MKITIRSEDELHAIRYALTELANRRQEQSIEWRRKACAQEAEWLRALVTRIVKEASKNKKSVKK